MTTIYLVRNGSTVMQCFLSSDDATNFLNRQIKCASNAQLLTAAGVPSQVCEVNGFQMRQLNNAMGITDDAIQNNCVNITNFTITTSTV